MSQDFKMLSRILDGFIKKVHALKLLRDIE